MAQIAPICLRCPTGGVPVAQWEFVRATPESKGVWAKSSSVKMKRIHGQDSFK